MVGGATWVVGSMASVGFFIVNCGWWDLGGEWQLLVGWSWVDKGGF